MKEKKLTEMFMLRLSREEKAKLAHTAEQLEMNCAALARLSLRYGLPVVRRKLPVVAPVVAEAPGE